MKAALWSFEMSLSFQHAWFTASAMLVITRHCCFHLDVTCTCWVPTVLGANPIL